MEFRKIKPTKRSDKDVGPSGPSYPRFSIDLKHLPEAKKWEPNGKTKYLIALELNMTGLEIGEDFNNASFEIHGIKVLPKPVKGKVIRYK